MAMILIGLLVAFFVYNDAKKRGHGAITAIFWAIGSGVVPFAYVILPLYLLLGRKAKERDQYYNDDVIDIEATVVEQTVSCTRCGSDVKEGLLACPYCHEPTGASKN